jgi:hypothetical protein
MNASKKLGALVTTATAAALAVALLAAPATATRTIKVPSQISIASKSLKFSGKVTVPKTYEPCAEQRKVTLFKVVTGGPAQPVGHATTNGKGNWTIIPQGSAGISLARFYAKVKFLSQGTAGTIYVCQAARSKTIKPTS